VGYLFDSRITGDDIHSVLLKHYGADISNEDMDRLNRIKNAWNFYDGFHWEKISDTDKPQVTTNYVRAFVDKFVAFEFGKGFNIKMKPEMEQIDGDDDPLDFLNEVWRYNNKLEKCVELGQSKSITGDGWVQVHFESKFDNKGKPNPEFHDPFDEFEKGKIGITVLPSAICFPTYDEQHTRENLKALRIMYPISVEDESFFRSRQKTVIYKQIWTKDRVQVFIGDEKIMDMPNKYKIIPFRQIRNVPAQGRNEGISDVEDIIPLNTEINLKKSDISEIIDYHSAPVTVVFGARIGQLERGANKVWGGLPKDAKVENLRLDGDLVSAQNYISDLKQSMHEVGSIPEGALGGQLAISNTSGVALQIALKPLLDRVQVKQVMSREGLEFVNKLILHIALIEGLIKMPDEVEVLDTTGEEPKKVKKAIKRSDYFYNEVWFESSLPKDTLLELQEIELEMRLGLESREGAMKRKGRANIQKKMAQIDEDMEKNPALYGKEDIEKQITLMREQAKIKPNVNAPSVKKSTTEKPVGTNSDGGNREVNSGYTNSPNPKR
jgi:Phage portal protein, SPP1 Gp6-like